MGFLAAAAPAILGTVGGLVAANNGPKDTFQATAPQIQTQNLTSQLSALTPQQQQLTQMLMQQAQGNGANPAQQMLNQATNRSIQQTAGQIASTRGISPALAARLGAETSASQTQNAAGQGALMGAQQQIAAEGLANQSLEQQQQTLQNAQAAQNAAITQGQLGAENINAGVASNNLAAAQQDIGGALKGISGGFGMAGSTPAGKWSGGTIGYSDGDVVQENLWDSIHKAFATPTPTPAPTETRDQKYQRILQQNAERMNGSRSTEVDPSTYARGGKVKAMVSPGEVYVPPEKVLAARKGNPLKEGVRIPGKAPVPGNSPANDIVPKDLETGGVVIKRTEATSKDKAKTFMQELAKKKEEGSGAKGFNRVLEAKKHLKNAHEALLAAHKAMGKVS
jgi:hypothetical protein